MDVDVARLTRAVASGDTEAFTMLYDTCFNLMYDEARRATQRDEAFCLDVVQDAMLRVIKSMKPMDTEAHLRGWLGRVVRSCAVDRLRSEIRRRRREAEAVRRRGVDEGAEDHGEALAWLRRRLAALDDTRRQLLWDRFGAGWTLQRIAESLGQSPGAVDGRIRRTLDQLRREAGDAP